METLEIVKSNYELERGKPMPSKLHGRLQARLLGLLYVSYSQTHTIYSELSLTLAPLFTKQVPDVALYKGATPYVASEEEIVVKEPPLLAIEIISPSQSNAELAAKVEHYLQAGVQSCWIILPEYRSVVLSTQPGRYQTFDYPDTLVDPVAEIELKLAQLFA